MPREMLELREVLPDNGVHDLTKLRPVLCMHAPRPNPPTPPSLTRRAAVRACAPAGPQQACAPGLTDGPTPRPCSYLHEPAILDNLHKRFSLPSAEGSPQ